MESKPEPLEVPPAAAAEVSDAAAPASVRSGGSDTATEASARNMFATESGGAGEDAVLPTYDELVERDIAADVAPPPAPIADAPPPEAPLDDPPRESVPAEGAPRENTSAEGTPREDTSPEDLPSEDAPPPGPTDTLSPAVRRLVRQYDLDITGIHGTGPAGRIRVGDVIGMLGRADGAPRSTDAARGSSAFGDETIVEARGGATPYRGTASRAPEAGAAAAPAPPVTTVYECDLSRVLSHRKARRSNVEFLLTGYFLVACSEALRAVPEVAAAGGEADARLGVLLASADGEVRTTLVDAVDTVDDSGPLASFDDRLRSFDQALRAIGDAPLDNANLLIHHYGAAGSLLATPTPLGAGHVASVGVGRARRQLIVKAADGDAGARVAAMCYVTLTFLPDRVPLNRANRFVAQLVRVLEQWPD